MADETDELSSAVNRLAEAANAAAAECYAVCLRWAEVNRPLLLQCQADLQRGAEVMLGAMHGAFRDAEIPALGSDRG